MTNDHWIQIAIGVTNAIAVLAAGILTPVIASRINQPKPKLDTAKPKSKILFMRMLKSPFFGLWVLILLNIVGLYLDTRPAPFKLRIVFSISMHMGAIFFTVLMMFLVKLLEFLKRTLDIVGDIAREIEDRPPSQT